MGDALDPGALDRAVEIGVEHAAAAAELQLEADALADLERGRAELLDEFRGGEAKQAGRDLGHRRLDDRAFGRKLRRAGGAGGQQQGRGENEGAHPRNLSLSQIARKARRALHPKNGNRKCPTRASTSSASATPSST